MYELTVKLGREIYRESKNYGSNQSSKIKKNAPLFCKSKKYTGNFFVNDNLVTTMKPIFYSSVHGKCGVPLEEDYKSILSGY